MQLFYIDYRQIKKREIHRVCPHYKQANIHTLLLLLLACTILNLLGGLSSHLFIAIVSLVLDGMRLTSELRRVEMAQRSLHEEPSDRPGRTRAVQQDCLSNQGTLV